MARLIIKREESSIVIGKTVIDDITFLLSAELFCWHELQASIKKMITEKAAYLFFICLHI